MSRALGCHPVDTRAMLGLHRGHLEVASLHEHLGYAWVARGSTRMTPGASRGTPGLHRGQTWVLPGLRRGYTGVPPRARPSHTRVTPGRHQGYRPVRSLSNASNARVTPGYTWGHTLVTTGLLPSYSQCARNTDTQFTPWPKRLRNGNNNPQGNPSYTRVTPGPHHGCTKFTDR